MTGENVVRGNSIELFEKRSSTTGAVVNLKKLFKTVKRIFTVSKPEIMATEEIVVKPCFGTDEELQNWLNEQIESKKMALH